MRLLYLSLTTPFSPDNGHKLRTCSVLHALKAAGHHVTLLCLNPDTTAPPDLQLARQVCDLLELVPHPSLPASVSPDYMNRIRAFVTPYPYSARRFASPTLRARLVQLIRLSPPDAIVCDTIFMSVNLPTTSIPVIINSPDAEHVILDRLIRHEPSLMRRLYWRIELAKLRRWERRICTHASLVMVCSRADRAAIRALSSRARIAVVPNVVDIAQYAPSPEHNQSVVLYTGGMDWYPNQDAAVYFAREIFPQLRHDHPALRFVVAGRLPPDRLRRKLSGIPGLELTGWVPDMRTQIARATICVAPLRIASGTRLKILEAAAMSRPTVSTTIGAEGLDFVNGEEIILADDPPAFVAGISALLRDPARRRTIGEAARRRVESTYATPALHSALRAALRQSVQDS